MKNKNKTEDLCSSCFIWEGPSKEEKIDFLFLISSFAL